MVACSRVSSRPLTNSAASVMVRRESSAMFNMEPSRTGRYLLYSVQDGGSDWRVLRVLDVASGKVLDDTVRWAKFTALGWLGDRGFFYARFPTPAEGAQFQARNYNHTVWFHRPLRPDRWHLHDLTCQTFVGGRGLALGHVFDQGGVHVATVAQEVLLRDRRTSGSF